MVEYFIQIIYKQVVLTQGEEVEEEIKYNNDNQHFPAHRNDEIVTFWTSTEWLTPAPLLALSGLK